MVAAGSEELLKTYDFCVLYTDMMNPTSNKIYQEIGYQKIADSIHIEFVLEDGLWHGIERSEGMVWCEGHKGARFDFQKDWDAERYLIGGKMFAMFGHDKSGTRFFH